MAHSCSTTGLVVCKPSKVSRNHVDMNISHFQRKKCPFERPGIMSSAACKANMNISWCRQSKFPSFLSGMSGSGGQELRAPSLKTASKLPQPIFRENASKLVVCSMPGLAASGVQVASTMFTVATAMVVPFYTVMILAPRWKWTKKLVDSELPYIVLGVMYVSLLALSWTPETLGLMFASKYWLPELPGITRMFSSTITVASAWIHLLVADLLCAKYVFLDGLQHKVETRHSLVLCLMMCPIGIISHLVTKVIMLFARRIDGESTTDMGKVMI